MTTLTLQASLMLLSFAALTSATANAEAPARTELSAVPVAELKASYLECDQLASTSLLGFGAAVECSMLSEELLERGFGGSFQQMLKWWRSAKNAPNKCWQDAGCEMPLDD